MAGIGFELQKLARLETISSMAAAAGHAAIIAAGPWLFTIFSLVTITALTQPTIAFEILITFRAIVIYAFSISIVVAAPVSIVATRLVADALWAKRPEAVRGLLIAAWLWALLAAALGLGLVFALLRPAAAIAVPLASMTASVALIWVTLSFCGAVRDYWGVTRSFMLGLAVALACTVVAAIKGYGASGMAVGFSIGLNVVLAGLAGRVLATFPHATDSVRPSLVMIANGFRHYWQLAAGAFIGTVGVWVDKWIFWASGVGESVTGGLWHAPFYDSAMFIASLAIIPSLSTFVYQIETDFFERYQKYYATIRAHGTLRQIEALRQRLAGYTLDHVALITVVQAGISAVLVLAAPAIVEALSLQFRQIAIMRFGALGIVFHFLLIASTAMLVFFDRRNLFLAVQALFAGLVIALTIASIALGENYYGVGYFLAALIAGFTAYRIAARTFDRLNFLTFLGNNPAILPSSRYSRRRR